MERFTQIQLCGWGLNKGKLSVYQTNGKVYIIVSLSFADNPYQNVDYKKSASQEDPYDDVASPQSGGSQVASFLLVEKSIKSFARPKRNNLTMRRHLNLNKQKCTQIALDITNTWPHNSEGPIFFTIDCKY